MEDLYNVVETALMGAAVVCTLGLVVYLAYLQYRKMKHRRAHRRRRARRAMKQSNGPAGGSQPSHDYDS
jgi:hypothetical protein